jgi:hypothetical protein
MKHHITGVDFVSICEVKIHHLHLYPHFLSLVNLNPINGVLGNGQASDSVPSASYYLLQTPFPHQSRRRVNDTR